PRSASGDEMARRLPTLMQVLIQRGIAADENVVVVMAPRRARERDAPIADARVPARVERRGLRSLEGVVRPIEVVGAEIAFAEGQVGANESTWRRGLERHTPLSDAIVRAVAMSVGLVEVRR